jgi:beta-lactamase regulating signal transducer with metallopeptidase domain/protocatechuate 3,4-dioxygenase beta subunit
MLAISVALLGRLWKNPAVMHLLWLAVLLKLFIPPIFNVPIPIISDLLQRIVHAQSVTETMSLHGRRFQDRAAPYDFESSRRMSDRASSHNDHPDLQIAPITVGKNEPFDLAHTIAVLWLFGSASVSCFYGLSIVRFMRSIQKSKSAPPNITAAVARLSRRLNLRRVPEVVMTSRTLPPLVWSVGGPPKVILPSELLAGLNDDAQNAILAHELVHISRRDDLVRLLELATTTLFWWHPVAWWACSRLRALEEQCCDSRVLELIPHQARDYALALVDTLEFLSSRPRTFVPLRTAVGSIGTLSRRIRMLANPGINRLGLRGFTTAMAVAAFPLLFAIAADEPTAPKDDSSQPVAANVGIVSGRVTNKFGEPLAGTRVTVAIPAIDMRFVDSEKSHKLLETKADADGNYRVEIPNLKQHGEVSVDVMQPGYSKLSGTLMRGGDEKRVKVAPGAMAEKSFSLEPSLYFKGIVLDENGKPIEGVTVSANSDTARSSSGVERTETRPDGTFEVFNYPFKPFEEDEEGTKVVAKGAVGFFHKDYIHQDIEDVYAIPAGERGTIRISLPTGHKISGMLIDADGKPVSHVMVEAEKENSDGRKATISDKNGKFVLRGLPAGAVQLQAHAMELKQKIKQTMDLSSDKIDMKLQLQRVPHSVPLKAFTVLGMQLADISPELQSEYDLYNEHGALIIDPGKNPDRLGIGDLAEGYAFWMVGEKPIKSVREFVNQVLAEATTNDSSIPAVRVVYSFRDVDIVGTNTQYLKLTKEDLEQLRAVAAALSNN